MKEFDFIKNQNAIKAKTILNIAEDFLRSAIRCGFDDCRKTNKIPALIPELVNRAFACELYLKALIYMESGELPKRGHKLDRLFARLSKSLRKEIYTAWLTSGGNDIQDCDYARQMFKDNLLANGDIFCRFRYLHEWSPWGTFMDIHSSFTEEQWHLHPANAERPFGSPPTSSGFLDQFVIVIKAKAEEMQREHLQMG